MSKEAIKLALEALEEIALAGMSGTGQESDEAMTAWHARQAWKFIRIAATALTPIKEALAQSQSDVKQEQGVLYQPAAQEAVDILKTLGYVYQITPNGLAWVEQQEQGEPKCKTHPDAPHGFVRNASHSEDRYVCECEFWEPPEQDEPVAYINVEQRKLEWSKYTSWETPTVVNLPKIPLYIKPQPKQEKDEPIAWFREENGEKIYYETKAWDDCLALYATSQNKEWVGLTDEHIINEADKFDWDKDCAVRFARKIEAKLKAKNGY